MPVKPLAHVITDYVCCDRHDKYKQNIHSAHLLSVAGLEKGSIAIINRRLCILQPKMSKDVPICHDCLQIKRKKILFPSCIYNKSHAIINIAKGYDQTKARIKRAPEDVTLRGSVVLTGPCRAGQATC